MPRGPGQRSPTVWPSARQQMLEVPLAPKPDPDSILSDIKLNSPHLTPVFSRKVYQIKTEGKDVVSPQPGYYLTTTPHQQRIPFELVSVYNSGGLTSEGSSDHDYGMSSLPTISSDAYSHATTPITPSPSSNFSRLITNVHPTFVTPGSEGSNHYRQATSASGGSFNNLGSKSGGAGVRSKARRWLDLDNGAEGQEPEGFKTPIKPASAIKRKLEICSSPLSNKITKSPAEKTRNEASLGLLTKKFVGLFHTDPTNTVDLNKASEDLQVQKRRIYDITNVLEGVGLVEKKSKNTVHWCGGRADVGATCSTQSDIDKLIAQEHQLDDLIRNTELGIKLLNDDKQYAYVSYQDLRNVPRFKNQTVMAIKAPPEAKLHVPHPSDGLKIYMSSETGEIEVFLCPEEESRSGGESADSDVELSPIKRIMLSEATTTSENDPQDEELNRIIESSLSVAAAGVGPGVPSSIVNVNGAGVLVGQAAAPAAAADLFSNGPTGVADFSDSSVATGLPLEPPLDDDYVLNLGDHEGLDDLFLHDIMGNG